MISQRPHNFLSRAGKACLDLVLPGRLWRLNPGLLALLLGMVMTVEGCGKKAPVAAAPPPPVPATQDQTDPVTSSRPVYQPPAAPIAVPATPGEPNLAQINHAYIGWIMQTHRHAKTYEEFVAASGVQIAPPPAGKKFIIDKRGYIALVSQ